jgi:hypothetical protein
VKALAAMDGPGRCVDEAGLAGAEQRNRTDYAHERPPAHARRSSKMHVRHHPHILAKSRPGSIAEFMRAAPAAESGSREMTAGEPDMGKQSGDRDGRRKWKAGLGGFLFSQAGVVFLGCRTGQGRSGYSSGFG